MLTANALDLTSYIFRPAAGFVGPKQRRSQANVNKAQELILFTNHNNK